MRTNRLIDGGGATHMACALAIRSREHEPGRARLAMEAFARALEIILSTRLEFWSRRIGSNPRTQSSAS